MICHSCYSIIHKFKKLSPSFQVLYLRSKRNVERLYKMKTSNISDLFPFVIFKRDILTDVYSAEATFLIPIEEMDFFFIL